MRGFLFYNTNYTDDGRPFLWFSCTKRKILFKDQGIVMLKLRTAKDGILIELRVQPKASSNRIAGLYGEALKVAVTAPAESGRANKALIKLLADRLDIKKDNIEIVSGHTSRTKTLKITGCKPHKIQALCEAEKD